MTSFFIPSIVIFSLSVMITHCQKLSTGDVGIDVSNHQATINWSQVKQRNPNVKFAFVKATEGKSYSDPLLVANFNGAKQANLRVGVYHYFRMSSSVVAQFVNIQKALNQINFDPAKDIFALDFEITASDRGLRSPKTQAEKIVISNQVYQLAQLLSIRLGIQPFIYTNPNSWNTLSDRSTRFNKYRLWIAHYTSASKPIIPKPWSNYNIWQYTDNGVVNGIRGGVDMNRILNY